MNTNFILTKIKKQMRFNTLLLSVISSLVTAATQDDICSNRCAFELANNMALIKTCNSNDETSTLQCQCYALKFGYDCLKKCDSSITSISVDELNLYCKNAGIDPNTILNDPRFSGGKGSRNSSIQCYADTFITATATAIIIMLL